MKFIDNKSDRKFSTDIDKLNESLYKINNFLKLSKDIDEMKRENLVKNDIQRKLSLKSQWLNHPHGSTTSLNSLPNFDAKSTASESNENIAAGRRGKENIDCDIKSLSTSIQSLDACTAAGNSVANRRANFLKNKAASIQNLDGAAERRKRRLANEDELNFIHSLDISDKEIEALSSEPEFGGPKFHFKSSSEKLSDSMKKIELQSFSDTMKSMQSQHTGPKVSTSGSQRDLSKFFPKKDDESPRTSKVNLSQKELKDVDLSKYFALSPVQERRSLPSPSQSPNLPRKMAMGESKKPPLNIAKQVILREAHTKGLTSSEPLSDIVKPKECTETPTQEVKKIERNEDFTLFDQQMDGAVTLRKPNKSNLLEPTKAKKAKEVDDILLDIHQERSPSREYSQLFDNDKSTIDNIDELFDEVAAKLVPELPKLTAPADDKKRKSEELDPVPNQNKKKIKSKPQKNTNNVLKKESKPKKNVPIWCRRSIDDDARDAFILSKLSDNLIDEIKMLEQQLEISVDTGSATRPIEKKKAAKKSVTTKPAEKPIQKCIDKPIDKPVETPIEKLVRKPIEKPVQPLGVRVERRNEKRSENPKRPDSGSLCGSDLDNAFEDIFKTVEIKAPPRKKSAKAKKLIQEKEQANASSREIAAPVDAVDALSEPKNKMRKNRISYDVPLSSPPRSRKNSGTSLTSKPPIVDDGRKHMHNIQDLHNAIADNLPHQVVLTKPPRSRKNSTAEAPPSPKFEEKRVSNKYERTSKPHKTQPNAEEWSFNCAYEPIPSDRKPLALKLENGIDTVDHRLPGSPAVMYDRPAYADVNQKHILKKAPPTRPVTMETRKMPPPKPIRRNKSTSSMDRTRDEEDDFNHVTISLNENIGQSHSGSSYSLDAISTRPLAPYTGIKSTSRPDVRQGTNAEPIQMRTSEKERIDAENLRTSGTSEHFRKSGAAERRGINLSEWTKRREILDRYQVKPDPITLNDRLITGYIPQDNLSNRQQNLSHVQNESRLSNDLTGLLESIASNNINAKSKRNEGNPASANSSHHLTSHARSEHDVVTDQNSSNDVKYGQSSQNYYKYPSRGIYDNLPAGSAITRPFERTIPTANDSDYYSSSSRRPSSNEFDYDNLIDREPMIPLRKRSLHEYRPLDSTDQLIERSKMIHNRKQEFMNEQIVGNNPYLKRILKRESREILPNTNTYEFNHRGYEQPITDYKSTIANTKLTKTPSTFSLNKKRGSNKSLNSISSTKRSVLDLFKRSPEKPKDKDGGCLVS